MESFSVRRSDFELLDLVARTAFENQRQDIHFYSLIDVFCNADYCPIGDNEKSFYYDNNHLSNYGAAKSAYIFEKIFLFP